MRIFIVIVAILACVSCANMAGLGGRAHYHQEFTDGEGATASVTGEILPGQKTTYVLDIKGPAGMKWEEITGMSYDWDDVTGKIAINSQSKGDTLAQAEAIKTVVPVLAELFKQGVIETAGTVAPVISGIAAGKANVEALRIQGRTASIHEVVEALKAVGYRVTPPENPAAEVSAIAIPPTN